MAFARLRMYWLMSRISSSVSSSNRGMPAGTNMPSRTTLVNASSALMKAGAKSVAACATHAVLSGPAVQRIKESSLSEVIITNSIPLSDEARATGKFKVVTIARLLANTVDLCRARRGL